MICSHQTHERDASERRAINKSKEKTRQNIWRLFARWVVLAEFLLTLSLVSTRAQSGITIDNVSISKAEATLDESAPDQEVPGSAPAASASEKKEPPSYMDIYGFAQLDFIYDFFYGFSMSSETE